ncbi:transcriptional regulator ATRX [Microplitis demolitor]|uniref:transcriptional regulator ATRX n=1 Tax=Microplitis demolitor TaxID=69319 RepID=UPI00235B6B9B|nr:transcriptional regulator ATRX [Microplitis demolitor]
MNNQIECLVKETPSELSYRKQFYPNAKSIKTDDLCCTVCNEDLIVSKKLLNHPVLGILMCKKCYEKNKSTDKKKCMLCFGGGKKLIECKNRKCSYLTCEECVSRINPKAKAFHKPGKWNCFACNITPLYKLRGISSAAMSSNSTEKSSNQPNKRIKNNTISKSKDKISKPVAETQKMNGENLSRCDSTSSSGTEFTKTKIIDTNLSSSRINHHDLCDTSDNDAQEDDALTKRQLFELKHNIKKLFDSMKEMGTKMLKDVEKLQQNFYTNKHKYKSSDVKNIMSECTNMIKSVQECTSKQEKKLIERHKTWCRKSKFKNTLAVDSRKKKNQEPVKESDDEKRASTPVEKNSKFVAEKSNSRLEISDCDDQVFSDDDADKNSRDKVGNNDDEVDDFNKSKDLFSDDELVADNHVDEIDVERNVERSPSRSSRKSSDESDDGNVRKKRLMKVKKKSGKVDSDESTDSNGKERRLSRNKLDKVEKKTDGGGRGELSSESDGSGRSGDKENEKKGEDCSDDVVLTPESQVKKLSYEVETDKDEDKDESRKEKEAKESLLKSSDSELTEVEDLGGKEAQKSGSELESEEDDKKKKNGKDKKSSSLENGGKKRKEAKKVLVNSSESEEDDDKIKKREEEAKKVLLNSSDSEDEGKKGNKDKNSRSNSGEPEREDDKVEKRRKEEEAKKALVISSSESGEDDEKIKKRKEEEAKRILMNSSSDSEEEINKAKKKSRSSSLEGDREDDKSKKQKEEEAKKSLLNSSSDSEEEINQLKKNEEKISRSNSLDSDQEDNKVRKRRKEEAKKALPVSSSDSEHEEDDKVKKQEEEARKITVSSSDSDHEDDKIKKRKKEEEAKKALLNSSSDSDREDDEKIKKQKEAVKKKGSSSSSESDHEEESKSKKQKEEKAKKALLNSSSDSDHEDDEKIKKQKEAKKKGSSSSESDHEDDKVKKRKKEEEAKKALLNSSSDSDHEDDEKIKKQKEAKKKGSSSSESDHEDDKIKKRKKEEEAKKALLNSSSDSDREDDEKIKKQKEAVKKKGSSSSSESDHEEESKSKKQKEEKAKKALLNSSSDSDHEDDEKIKKQKEEAKKKGSSSSSESDHEEESKSKKQKEEEAKKALLNSSSDSDHENDEKIKKQKEAKKKGSISSSESDNEVNSKRVTRRAAEAKKITNDVEKESDSDIETISSKNSSKTKSKRFQLNNNIHYNNDKKLKLKSLVKLERLSKRILSRHSKALRLSREYLENKKVLSLMSLDGLEKKNKKKQRSDSSTDEDSKHSRSRKRTKISSEDDTLLDHLKKVETGNGDNDSSNSSLEDDDSSKNNKNKEMEPQSLVQQADKVAKASILADSESSDVEETPMEFDVTGSQDKKKETEKNNTNNKGDKDDDDKKKSKKNKDDGWKRSKLLTGKILDSDSDEENEKAQKKLSQRSRNDSDSKEEADDSIKSKKKSTRTRRRRLNSDSDVKISDDSDSDSAGNKNDKDDDSDDLKKSKIKKTSKRKNKSDSSDSSYSMVSKKSKTKRRRIRAVAEDSEDSSDDDDLLGSQGGANKSGRKNIRKVLKDKHVADGTLQAAKQEEERIRRMAERQKLYNEMYEARLASEAKVDKLVLDFDEETKEVLLEVDENLVKRLKPHQAKGIKFMWDACFESLERTKKSEGSGCILAHCMGLGKSFQVVTLSHTLLMHSEKTGINKILIVVPLSTVLNWMNEFKIWLSEVENGNDIELYEMTKAKTNIERKCHLENWQRTGGVLIIGYEMFRNLCAIKGKVRKSVQEAILKCILDPGPDLIICDEGHLLKNEDSAISKAIRRVKTLRRIVLTGTPLQNNLIEYHCMVQFVKPNLLGTKKEFSNRFVNPIQNGQFDDSTEYDVKLMKKRAHVLHKMLEGSVQRFDYSVLTPFLPPKQEYVISIRLSDVQVKLYQYYIDNFARKHKGVGGSLFADFQALSRLWTHPFVVKMHTENSEKLLQKKRDAESDSEGSLKDFIDDGSDTESSSSESSNNSSGSDVVALDDDDGKKKNKKKGPPPKRGTRANPVIEDIPVEPEEPTVENRQWWTEFIKDEDFDDMRLSAKLIILFDIIKEAEAIGDKVLVFSQSLYSLTLIEKFLSMIDDETQNGNELETLDKHTGCWVIGQDYFRFDGQTSAENRSHWVKSFNRPSNTRARLFLISTRAGGLGINLTAANRVVIFDASWNPSHDVQSIFRIYRFGQKKPCYVYRLLAAGTMEEKIYNRQVTKLSLSCRVVDELQIERHYSNNDLAELYKFDPPGTNTPDLALPKDRLLAEIFLRHKNLVETFHEHDSLLENIAEEELDAEERKQAWQEYEDEKAGKPLVTAQMINYQNQQQMMLMQQYNNQMMNSLNLSNPAKQVELSQLMSMFQQDYPHLTEQAQRGMALKALSNMYNYVENQVIGRGLNPSIMTNIANPSNPTATLANALAQQEYSRFHSGFNQQNLSPQQRQMLYAQSFGNVNSLGKNPQMPTGAINPNASASKFSNNDDDIIEIPSSSSTRVGGVTQASSNSPKRQEE